MSLVLKLRASDWPTMEAAMIETQVLVRDGEELRPSRGITVSPELIVWTVKPVIEYDADGEAVVVSEGVRDPRYHCDVLVGPPALEMTWGGTGVPIWDVLLTVWLSEGSDGHPNAAEASKMLHGVEVIDGSTIKSPSHGFAGI